MSQWLRLCTPNSRGVGSIPGQGTGSHTQQLRICLPQLRPHAANKYINKYLKRKKQMHPRLLGTHGQCQLWASLSPWSGQNAGPGERMQNVLLTQVLGYWKRVSSLRLISRSDSPYPNGSLRHGEAQAPEQWAGSPPQGEFKVTHSHCLWVSLPLRPIRVVGRTLTSTTGAGSDVLGGQDQPSRPRRFCWIQH